MADKIDIQKPGAASVPAEARAATVRLQAAGRALLSHLYMLVRNARLYSADNRIFEKPLQLLCDAMNAVVASEGRLELVAAQDAFYLNQALIRMDQKSAESLRELRQDMQARDIGGFTLEQPVTVTELRDFVFIFSKENAEAAGERGVSARKLLSLKLRRYEKLKEIFSQARDPAAQPAEGALDRRRYALVVYARLVNFMQRFLAGQRGERAPIPWHGAMRLMQDMVDMSYSHRAHFLGLTCHRGAVRSLAHRLANHALLSVVVGAYLGLEREELRDLGLAALFCEIGLAGLEDMLAADPKQMTAEGRAALASAHGRTLRAILRFSPFTPTAAAILTAVHDSGLDFGKPIRDLSGRVSLIEPGPELVLPGRLLALIRRYGALVEDAELTPELALGLMNGEERHRFDPALLPVFCRVMQGLTRREIGGGGKVEIF